MVELGVNGFFNAEGRRGKRRGSQRGLEVIDDSFDAVFEMDDVEVD
jgi:hypothetical protein